MRNTLNRMRNGHGRWPSICPTVRKAYFQEVKVRMTRPLARLWDTRGWTLAGQAAAEAARLRIDGLELKPLAFSQVRLLAAPSGRAASFRLAVYILLVSRENTGA